MRHSRNPARWHKVQFVDSSCAWEDRAHNSQHGAWEAARTIGGVYQMNLASLEERNGM